MDTSINNRIEEIDEKISDGYDIIESIEKTVKENEKYKKACNPEHSGNPGQNEKTKRKDYNIEKSEDFQLKGAVNVFNKIREENFSNLKKEMPMNIQEAYKTPNRLDQKINSSHHIITETPNALNKERILKAVREKGQVTYKARPIRITPDFSACTMILDRCYTNPKRIQMPAQATIPSKNSQLLYMEKKTRYSMIKLNLHNISPQIQPYKG